MPDPNFNTDWSQRLISHTDMHPVKVPHVPGYLQIFKLLDEELDAVPSSAGQPFAYIPTSRHNFFNVPLESNFLRSWIVEHRKSVGLPPPSSQQLREALKAFVARPLAGSISGTRRRMNLRTAWNPFYRQPLPQVDEYDRITGYDHHSSPPQAALIFALDTRGGRHVAITPQGWSLQPSRTEFVYDPVQQPLPDPTESDPTDPDPQNALAPFRQLLRLDHPDHDGAWQALVSWILAAMQPAKDPSFHDYPILNLVGPANSGKSLAAKLLTQLLDPTGVPLHSIPTTERRLHVLAAAQHVLAFDNPGKINPEKSRFLSRLSTGIGSLYRQFPGTLVRPIILTTRQQQETRHLSNRVVDVALPPIEEFRSQEEIWQEFQQLRPAILGALLTLLSRNLDVPPPHLPNRRTKKQKLDELIPQFLAGHGGAWSGTVTQLNQALNSPVTLNALGRYLTVPRKKNNGTVTIHLCEPKSL